MTGDISASCLCKPPQLSSDLCFPVGWNSSRGLYPFLGQKLAREAKASMDKAAEGKLDETLTHILQFLPANTHLPAQTERHPRDVNPCHLIPWSESATAGSLFVSVCLTTVSVRSLVWQQDHTQKHMQTHQLCPPLSILLLHSINVKWTPGRSGASLPPSFFYSLPVLYEKPHRWQQKITCPPIHWHDREAGAYP